MTINKRLYTFLYLFVALTAANTVYGQVNAQFGEPKIDNYLPADYLLHNQNWDIIQDEDGLVYVANQQGLLIYDGVGWETSDVFGEQTVRCFGKGLDGKIFVGLEHDFGYIERDEEGKLFYKKIYIPKDSTEKLKSYIIEIAVTDENVFFLTKNMVYLYDFKDLISIESEESFIGFVQKSNHVFVKYQDGKIVGIEDHELKTQKKDVETGIKEVFQLSEKEVIIRKADGSIFLVSDFWENPFYVEWGSSNIFSLINSVERLNDDLISIGTRGEGLYFVNNNGEIIHHINTELDLVDNIIHSQFIDREKNLWLACDKGLSKIALNRQITYFKMQSNIYSTIQDIADINEHLYFATRTGIYYWDKKKSDLNLQAIDLYEEESWDLSVVKYNGHSKILAALNSGLYEIKGNYGQLVDNSAANIIYQSKFDSSLVIVGNYNDGISFYDLESNLSKKTNRTDLSAEMMTIEEDKDGNVWIGTIGSGVFVLKKGIGDITEWSFNHYDGTNGLPEKDVYLAEYQGKILFGTLEGIFTYEASSDSFIQEKWIEDKIGVEKLSVLRMSVDYDNNLWIIGYKDDINHFGFIRKTYYDTSWTYRSLLPLANSYNSFIYAVHHEKNTSRTWLGGSDGLVKYEVEDKSLDPKLNINVSLRKIIINSDSLFYSGHFNRTEEQSKTHKLPYSGNSLSFEFAALYHKYNLENSYRHRLKGMDEKWSEWSKNHRANYTNLHEGDYDFMIQAVNIFGQESDISHFRFKILPPWYRTWWAYVSYVILLTGIVYLIVTIYTKNLKAIIVERTQEIRIQKDEVEHQKIIVEKKNHEITSSINYARRIQEAILPPMKLVKEYLADSFIFYKPKDIVAGDFYWMEIVGDHIFYAAADCTGHGVPGAMVSVVCSNGLKRSVNEFGLSDPGEILDKTTELVVETFERSEREVQDGMDISLLRLNTKTNEIVFSGAHNPLYVVSKIDGQELDEKTIHDDTHFIKEYKGDKQPVGKFSHQKPFTSVKVDIKKDDFLYVFSDGFPDQFGGEDGKKFMYKPFKKLLLSIHQKDPEFQRDELESVFEKWKGSGDQIDDVVVIGLKV